MDINSNNFFNENKKIINSKKIIFKKSNLIKNNKYIKLLEKMKIIRETEKLFRDMLINKEIKCPTHLCIGQEATSVGVCENLKKIDKVFGNHRSHGHYIAMGGSIFELIAEITGKKDGCSKGMGGSMHLQSKKNGFIGSNPIVAGTIPLALGAAFASKKENNNSIAVVFFGDGAAEEGVFHEALNLASVMNLPILFAVENNLLSSHLDINLRQPSNKIARFAKAHKVNNEVIDGNNILEVFLKSKKIINNIRKNQKPFLLEMITYRQYGHVGPNKDIDVGLIRNKKEMNFWEKKDPVIYYEKFLLLNKIIKSNQIKNLDKKIINKLNTSYKKAKLSKYPNSNSFNNYVFSK